MMVDRVGYASCAVCWAMLFFYSADGSAADWGEQAGEEAEAEAALAATWLECIIVICVVGRSWLVAEHLLQNVYLLQCACY